MPETEHKDIHYFIGSKGETGRLGEGVKGRMGDEETEGRECR
jgi:hypothetical protein